jgi:hypothetical protein
MLGYGPIVESQQWRHGNGFFPKENREITEIHGKYEKYAI